VTNQLGNKRAEYFYKKKQLELALLLSESDTIDIHVQKSATQIDLPSFTWGAKEYRSSVNRLDVLIKEAKIGINYQNFDFALSRLHQIKQLLDNRQLDTSNAWYLQYQELKTEFRNANRSFG
jgi:hypothetical protein